MKILARHKWVSGAVITESVDDKKSTIDTSYRRFTATIRGFQNWKIFEGLLRDNIAEEIIKEVKRIRDLIDKGKGFDEEVFNYKGYFLK